MSHPGPRDVRVAPESFDLASRADAATEGPTTSDGVLVLDSIADLQQTVRTASPPEAPNFDCAPSSYEGRLLELSGVVTATDSRRARVPRTELARSFTDGVGTRTQGTNDARSFL